LAPFFIFLKNFLFCFILCFTGKRKKKEDSASTSRIDEIIATEIVTLNLRNKAIQKFSFHDLIVATDNFKIRYLLGQGGFGNVYRGDLFPKNQVCKILL